MNRVIEYLPWDSTFFDRRIGKLSTNKSFLSTIEKENMMDFDLVYIFSDKPLVGFNPVDIKVTFQKRIENNKCDFSDVSFFDVKVHSYNQLLELVFMSGYKSRFLTSAQFNEHDFKRLYKRWIDNSINSEDSKVLVLLHRSKLVGFTSFSYKDNSFSIDLIAVSKEMRGKGIGRKLICAVEKQIKAGEKICVSTQLFNSKACNFYSALGFKKKSTQFIYHYEPNPFQ